MHRREYFGSVAAYLIRSLLVYVWCTVQNQSQFKGRTRNFTRYRRIVKFRPLPLYSPGKDLPIPIRVGVGPRAGLEASKERKVVSPVVKSHYGERNFQFNTLRTGSFKLFKRPLPGFLTILTL